MKCQHVLVLVLAVLLGASHYLGLTPVALSAFSLLASGMFYYSYASDKAAAMTGAWRVPENALHMTAVLFGWPGALIAQERLRHKARKKSFRAILWFTVPVNLGGLAWLHSPNVNDQLRESVYQVENLVISHVPNRATVAIVLFLTNYESFR